MGAPVMSILESLNPAGSRVLAEDVFAFIAVILCRSRKPFAFDWQYYVKLGVASPINPNSCPAGLWCKIDFATIGGMFFLNGLPMHYHPVLKYDQIRRGMDDTFFIVIEARDPRYHLANTRALLEKVGGKNI